MSETGRDVDLTCDEVRELAGAFVLGALDADELAAVRAHLATCPHPHPEMAELGSVLPALAQTVPIIEPPAELKARIMAAAAADGRARGRAGSTSPADAARVTTPTPLPTAEERVARRRRVIGAAWLLQIAAVLLLVVVGARNLGFQNELAAARAYDQALVAVLHAAAQPGSLSAILTADGGPGSGLAAVDARGDLVLAMRELAPTSGATVYEAWVIGRDGVPAPLGSFRVGNDGIASFRASGLPRSSGIILALTLESGPGATTPTLPIISKGVASPIG